MIRTFFHEVEPSMMHSNWSIITHHGAIRHLHTISHIFPTTLCPHSPSSIAELRKKVVQGSMQITVLNNGGVAFAKEILGLVHEWFGNSTMVGDLDDVFVNGSHFLNPV